MRKTNKTATEKEDLAIHCAAGGSVRDWAKAKGVNERTAYRLYADPAVKEAIASHRRLIVDQAISRLSSRAVWAVDALTVLAKDGRSEPVKLGALRELLGQLVNLSNWTDLERRMDELDAKLEQHRMEKKVR